MQPNLLNCSISMELAFIQISSPCRGEILGLLSYPRRGMLTLQISQWTTILCFLRHLLNHGGPTLCTAFCWMFFFYLLKQRSSDSLNIVCFFTILSDTRRIFSTTWNVIFHNVYLKERVGKYSWYLPPPQLSRTLIFSFPRLLGSKKSESVAKETEKDKIKKMHSIYTLMINEY